MLVETIRHPYTRETEAVRAVLLNINATNATPAILPLQVESKERDTPNNNKFSPIQNWPAKASPPINIKTPITSLPFKKISSDVVQLPNHWLYGE